MLRTLQAAEIAGIRAIAVHAKDDDARTFYERFGFVPAPTDPYHLFALLKDVRAILKQRCSGSAPPRSAWLDRWAGSILVGLGRQACL
jgi:hypothetical protein